MSLVSIFILGLDDVSGDKNTCNSCFFNIYVVIMEYLEYMEYI